VTTLWMLASLLVPVGAAVAAGLAFRARPAPPVATVVLNAVMPGSGLAAAGRPLLEVVLGVLVAVGGLLIAGGRHSPGVLVVMAVAGGVWALMYTPYAGLISGARTPRPSPEGVGPATPHAQGTTTPPAGAPPEPQRPAAPEQGGYAVSVRCTECGAGVEVPVLARMARCAFCGSHHLVVGHEETLYVTIPEKVAGPDELREAVLDHYRYIHYLRLYRASVAPLERNASDVSPSGALVSRPELNAAAAAAEAVVSAKADSYRARLAGSLEVTPVHHFLAPYRHGMGSLYQVAFGRSPSDQEKRLRFAVGTVEAAVLATDAMALPQMGKLSYLRALVPAADAPPAVKTLPLDLDADGLRHAYGNLDRKQLTRDLQVIRIGSSFTEEVAAVVWRPYWIARAEGAGIADTLLVDSAAGSVAGTAPFLDGGTLQELPERARRPGSGLRFVPMECPTCGSEFSFDVDAVLHFCRNCHRVCRVEGEHKAHVPYRHQPMPEEEAFELVPFWTFPLRLRTGDGRLLTDLRHLKDGIDGTLDQIGEDAAVHQHAVLVPAFRCIHPNLTARAFHHLLVHTLRRPPTLSGERFPLEEDPRPWAVSLEEPQARNLLPLYLANAFSRRDIVRANVHQVAAWLFEARQEAAGTLAYVPLPRELTEPFRPYLGRTSSPAVHHARAET